MVYMQLVPSVPQIKSTEIMKFDGEDYLQLGECKGREKKMDCECKYSKCKKWSSAKSETQAHSQDQHADYPSASGSGNTSILGGNVVNVSDNNHGNTQDISNIFTAVGSTNSNKINPSGGCSSQSQMPEPSQKKTN